MLRFIDSCLSRLLAAVVASKDLYDCCRR